MILNGNVNIYWWCCFKCHENLSTVLAFIFSFLHYQFSRLVFHISFKKYFKFSTWSIHCFEFMLQFVHLLNGFIIIASFFNRYGGPHTFWGTIQLVALQGTILDGGDWTLVPMSKGSAVLQTSILLLQRPEQQTLEFVVRIKYLGNTFKYRLLMDKIVTVYWLITYCFSPRFLE